MPYKIKDSSSWTKSPKVSSLGDFVESKINNTSYDAGKLEGLEEKVNTQTSLLKHLVSGLAEKKDLFSPEEWDQILPGYNSGDVFWEEG